MIIMMVFIMILMMKIKLAIAQPVLKLGVPDFAILTDI